MRSLGLIGLLLALLAVGLLVKQQVGGPGSTATGRSAPAAAPQEVREAIDAASQARPLPDDAK